MCSNIKTTGKKLSLRVPINGFVAERVLVPTVRGNVIGRRAVSTGIQRVLRALVTFKTLSAPERSGSVSGSGTRSGRVTLSLTERKMILLGGSGNALPCQGNEALMVKPGTSVVPAKKKDKFVAPCSMISLCSNVIRLGNNERVRLLSSDVLCGSVSRRVCASNDFARGNFGNRCCGAHGLAKRLFRTTVRPTVSRT